MACDTRHAYHQKATWGDVCQYGRCWVCLALLYEATTQADLVLCDLPSLCLALRVWTVYVAAGEPSTWLPTSFARAPPRHLCVQQVVRGFNAS